MNSDLQQETGTLRHEDNPDEGGQSGEETHQDEHSPAVDLKLSSNGKAPTWKPKKTVIMTTFVCKIKQGLSKPPNPKD